MQVQLLPLIGSSWEFAIPPGSTISTLRDLRLLVIDDDEDMCFLVNDYIRETNRGWTVDCVETYEAGKGALASANYDAVLLDNFLGTRTGLDLLAEVGAMENIPPIVLLTGAGDHSIDLAAMAAGASDYLDKNSLGSVVLERTVRHAVERRVATTELRVSEARYRGLFERAGDAVLFADDDGCYVDANPAACRLLGLPRHQVVGRSLTDFIDRSELLPDAAAGWAAFLAAGEMRGSVRLRRPDGTVRSADFVATANFTPGRHLSVLRDNTDQIAAQDAADAAVAALQLSEARFRSTLDGVGMHAAILDPTGNIVFVNRHLLDRSGWTETDLLGTDSFSHLSPQDHPRASRARYRAGVAAGVVVAHVENRWRTRGGEWLRIAWTNSPIRDDEGRIVAVASVGEDITARRQSEYTQAQLVAAIEQAAESIVVTDAKGVITFANPAFERASGTAAADVVGREAADVFQGADAAHVPHMAQGMASAGPSTHEWQLQRPDGSSYWEQVTISPVRNAAGLVVSYVRVARDVTAVHRIQASLDDERRARAAFARALAQFKRRESPEATAQDITDAVSGLPGISVALILSFEEAGVVRFLAATGPEGHPIQVGRALTARTAEYLRRRAALGPWTEQGDDDDFDEAFTATWDALGLRAGFAAPIGEGDEAVGLIVLGTADEVNSDAGSHQSAAIGFAAAAESLLAGPLATQKSLRASRRRIDTIISGTEFDGVFQPIVDMVTGIAVGYEGLTRFRDGTRPDLAFAEAWACGAGLALEAATLDRMIVASQELPVGRWVSLNVSASLVLEPGVLARVLSRRTRPIVLEITEHDVIADYAAVRTAIALLGPDVRVAVDDAGAGAANFSHIVELRPDFVKVDMGLVRGVNRDLTRQALIVGLRHFAQATNAFVIAEGVETEEERRSLIGLDLMLGQGYFFARPGPASGAAVISGTGGPQPIARSATRAEAAPGPRAFSSSPQRADAAPPVVPAPATRAQTTERSDMIELTGPAGAVR